MKLVPQADSFRLFDLLLITKFLKTYPVIYNLNFILILFWISALEKYLHDGTHFIYKSFYTWVS